MYFSFIIPVYNRPDEVEELLKSIAEQDYHEDFEVVIIEDGSTIPCHDVVKKYEGKMFISYFNKPNSGPGDSRNFGMKQAMGSYFLILDSDCILPEDYLTSVDKNLKKEFVDCFGGPDNALDSFSPVQKAINFTMTSHQSNLTVIGFNIIHFQFFKGDYIILLNQFGTHNGYRICALSNLVKLFPDQ